VLFLIISSISAQNLLEAVIYLQDGAVKKGHVAYKDFQRLSRGIILREMDENGNAITFTPREIKKVYFVNDSMTYFPVVLKYKNVDNVDFEEKHLALQIYDGTAKLYRIDLCREDEIKVNGFYTQSSAFKGTNKIIYVLHKDNEYYSLRKMETYTYNGGQIHTKDQYKNFLNYLYKDKNGAQQKIKTLPFTDYSMGHFIAWTESGEVTSDNKVPAVTILKSERRTKVFAKNIFYDDNDRDKRGLYGFEAGIEFEAFRKGSNKKLAFIVDLGLGTFAPVKKSDEIFYELLTFREVKPIKPIFVRATGGGVYYFTRKRFQPYVSGGVCFTLCQAIDLSSMALKYNVGCLYKRFSLAASMQLGVPYTNYYNSNNGSQFIGNPVKCHYNLYELQLAYVIGK